MKYVLIKHKNLKLLINERLHMQPLVDCLLEIEDLADRVTKLYKNVLNATDKEINNIEKQKKALTSKIGYKIIGVPFSNHDAELYALNNKLEYTELELTSTPRTH